MGQRVAQGQRISNNLPEGVYRVRYTVIDAAGNKITVSTLIVGVWTAPRPGLATGEHVPG
jgi:hypothetical protein